MGVGRIAFGTASSDPELVSAATVGVVLATWAQIACEASFAILDERLGYRWVAVVASVRSDGVVEYVISVMRSPLIASMHVTLRKNIVGLSHVRVRALIFCPLFGLMSVDHIADLIVQLWDINSELL